MTGVQFESVQTGTDDARCGFGVGGDDAVDFAVRKDVRDPGAGVGANR